MPKPERELLVLVFLLDGTDFFKRLPKPGNFKLCFNPEAGLERPFPASDDPGLFLLPVREGNVAWWLSVEALNGVEKAAALKVKSITATVIVNITSNNLINTLLIAFYM